MSEFGSTTIIPDDAALLILDCFDTLVELEGEGYRVRKGIGAFLDHYGERLGIPLVVHSDAAVDHLHAVLETTGIGHHFRRAYGSPDATEQSDEGLLLKRLDLPLRDFGVVADLAIFIGDSKLDVLSAQRYGVGFIRVPGSADTDFDFRQLIKGPSNYRSQEYSTRLFRRYGKEPPHGA